MKWLSGTLCLLVVGCAAGPQSVTPAQVLAALKEAGYKGLEMKPCSNSTSGATDCQEILIGDYTDYAKDPLGKKMPTTVSITVFRDKASQDAVSSMGSAIGMAPVKRGLTSIYTIGGDGAQVANELDKRLPR